MVAPTLVPIIGSIIEGEITETKATGALKVITTHGFILSLAKHDVQSAQIIQTGTHPTQSLYRLFVSPDSELSVKLRASAWLQMDGVADGQRATLNDSGASKRIEDTA